MRPQVPAHFTLTIAAPTRHTPCGRACAALSVLAALLLIGTLIGPSAFIVAKKAASSSHGIQISRNHVVGSTDKPNGHSKPSEDLKRPRGILNAKNVGNIFALAAPLIEGTGLRIVGTEPSREVIFTTEAEPKDNILPPQLLQRPPPYPFL